MGGCTSSKRVPRFFERATKHTDTFFYTRPLCLCYFTLREFSWLAEGSLTDGWVGKNLEFIVAQDVRKQEGVLVIRVALGFHQAFGYTHIFIGRESIGGGQRVVALFHGEKVGSDMRAMVRKLLQHKCTYPRTPLPSEANHPSHHTHKHVRTHAGTDLAVVRGRDLEAVDGLEQPRLLVEKLSQRQLPPLPDLCLLDALCLRVPPLVELVVKNLSERRQENSTIIFQRHAR